MESFVTILLSPLLNAASFLTNSGTACGAKNRISTYSSMYIEIIFWGVSGPLRFFDSYKFLISFKGHENYKNPISAKWILREVKLSLTVWRQSESERNTEFIRSLREEKDVNGIFIFSGIFQQDYPTCKIKNNWYDLFLKGYQLVGEIDKRSVWSVSDQLKWTHVYCMPIK